MPMTLRYDYGTDASFSERQGEQSSGAPPAVPTLAFSTPTAPVSPLDADDSIVLSDIVRSGEASRLRRRGAMRLDHGALSQPGAISRGTRPRRTSASSDISLAADFRWGAALDPADDDSGTWNWSATGVSELAAAAESERDGVAYTLTCGAWADDDGDEPDWDGAGAGGYTPAPMPWPDAPRPAARRSTKDAQPRPRRRAGGCGALVHVHAVPRWRCSAWTARCAAPESVVALGAEYFEPGIGANMVRSACGCVREGIGCAVCGNPLGTRYKPCQAAVGGLFSHSPCRTVAEGSAGGTCANGGAAAGVYVYTFFASAVGSDPPFTFPPLTSTSPSTPMAPVESAPPDSLPQPVSPRTQPQQAPHAASTRDRPRWTSLSFNTPLSELPTLRMPLERQRSNSSIASSGISSPGELIYPSTTTSTAPRVPTPAPLPGPSRLQVPEETRNPSGPHDPDGDKELPAWLFGSR